MRRWRVAALLALAGFAFGSLVLGAPYLELPLPGGMPAGNVLAAMGLCSTAGASVLMVRRQRILRLLAIASLAGAALWLPVSVALAGNLALVFNGARGDAWTMLSLATLVAVLGSLTLACAATVWRLVKSERPA